MADKFPECEKLAACQEDRLVIEAFLEWCESKNLELRDWNHLLSGEPQAINMNRAELIACYLGIDLRALENERRQMLEEIQKSQQWQKDGE